MTDENKDLREVVIRAIVDQEFRDALLQDQDVVLSREGYSLDENELSILADLQINDWNNITVTELDERLDEIARGGRLVIGSFYIRER